MKATLLGLIALLLLALPARAGLTAIEFSPASPVAGEPVLVTVVGSMPDLCWTLLDQQCGEVVDLEAGITVRTYDCYDQPCGFCHFAEVPIEVSCTIVFAAAGSYVISAREIPNSLRFPSFPEISATVEVSGGVGVESASWSTIKGLYR